MATIDTVARKHTVIRFTLPALGLAAVLALTACGGATDSAGSATTNGSSTVSPTASATDSASPSAAEHNDADAAFAAGMLPHHEQAVAMADLAATRASSAEVKDLASRIRAAQGPEITRLKGWLDRWDADMASGSGMESMEGMEGMNDGSGEGMMTDRGMKQLEQATGSSFDVAFLTGMLAHHQSAVEMAKTELADGEDTAAKALAQSVVTTQSQEIAEIQTLLAKAKG